MHIVVHDAQPAPADSASSIGTLGDLADGEDRSSRPMDLDLYRLADRIQPLLQDAGPPRARRLGVKTSKTPGASSTTDSEGDGSSDNMRRK